jgi:uncharacterized integral membrane protein (TIGR00698 family)
MLSPRSADRGHVPSLVAAQEAARRHLPRLGAVPGLLLCAALAWAAEVLGRASWLQHHGFSALTLAIVLGMVWGNTLYPQVPRMAAWCGPGVGVAKQTLLRAGVVLYGLRLTVQDIAQVGLHGVLVDVLMLGSTFALAVWLGTRVLRLDRRMAMLIGAGSAICGAAAVMATEPVVKARAEQVTVAVATVVVFGTLAIFVYPLLFTLHLPWQLLPATPTAFGVYVGSTIHEVAQVVAAARSISPEAAGTAVIAKMVRVMLLAPFLMALAAVLAWRDARKGATRGVAGAEGGLGPTGRQKVSVPWFALGFVAVVLLHSLPGWLAPVVAEATEVDTALLAMAMAALGLATHVGAIRQAGFKPLLLAALLFAWLVVGGAMVNHLVGQ